jgi:hypothetical protein
VNHFRRLFLATTVAILPALAGRCALAEDRPPSKLAFTRGASGLYFDTGVLRGSLGEGGKSLGLRPVTHIASNVQMAGDFGILSPYRMLTSDARFGTAAWDWASKSELLADGAAKLHWLPDKEHPLEMTGVYRWSADDTLDLELTVKAQRDLRRFELFLASYLNGFPAALACVQQTASAGGSRRFMEAVKAAGDWQTFPRDDTAVAIFSDGRWARPPHPVTWKIMPRLAAPLALRRDAKSGLTVVLMSRPNDCFAVSMPYGEEGHRSVYLSLFGGDLTAGQEASAGGRLVIGKDIADGRALELYRAYLKKK